MKPRTLQEEVGRIKNMMLQEGGWNLPDDVNDNDPHFNEPDGEGSYNSDDLDTWEYDPKLMEFTLHGFYGGTATLFLDVLFGFDGEFDKLFPEDAGLNQTAEIVNNPELYEKITSKIIEYIEKYGVDWSNGSGDDYSGPDEYDGGGDTRWMDYINEE